MIELLWRRKRSSTNAKKIVQLRIERKLGKIMRHFLTLKDFTKEEILEIIDIGLEIKKDLKAGVYKEELKKQTLAMIFEKSSTRTRVSTCTFSFKS